MSSSSEVSLMFIIKMAVRLSLSHPTSFVLKNIHNFIPLSINQICSSYEAPSLSVIQRRLPQWSPPAANAPCFLVQCRHYGRKVKPKPEKITFFEYSGDLRTLPAVDKDELLNPYVDLLKDQLDGDDFNKKLASLEFASVAERNRHMQQTVQDRIIELFGPDSELEQRIARFTLQIRQKIPYCIENRTDKYQKIWLLKSIFHRRRLLNKLRDLDHERFEWLLRELKIRYVIPQDQEEWKGWKHVTQEATKSDTLTLKRQKLDQFMKKLEAEKESFAERKAKVLSEIERDLEAFGLSRDFLDDVQKKEVEKKKRHKILTWEERVKLGMTDKIKEYYG